MILHIFYCRFRKDTGTQQFAVSSFCHLEYSFEFDCNLAISICIPINHFQVEPLCSPLLFPFMNIHCVRSHVGAGVLMNVLPAWIVVSIDFTN